MVKNQERKEMNYEDRNYQNDHRVRARERKMSRKIRLDENKMIMTVETDEGEKQHPFVWEVCPTCRGKGYHVNPSIDADGLTGEDFAEDPDLAETYFSGGYDVVCYECDGKRVVPRAKSEQVDPETGKGY
jgi:hypothetical protein